MGDCTPVKVTLRARVNAGVRYSYCLLAACCQWNFWISVAWWSEKYMMKEIPTVKQKRAKENLKMPLF
jgi:hypothetical protein